MKFKLDENLGVRGAEVLRAAGHDVATVVEQAMTSANDVTVAQVLDALVQTLVLAVARSPIEGRLWIIEPGRVREYLSQEQ